MSKPGPRELMPKVAEQIDQMRVKWGKEHVDECIKRGMRGEPDWFYAFENGHVVGTPFKADKVTAQVLAQAVMLGGRYAVVMRPGKEQHGAN